MRHQDEAEVLPRLRRVPPVRGGCARAHRCSRPSPLRVLAVNAPGGRENPALLARVSVLPPGAAYTYRAEDGSFWFFRCLRAADGGRFYRAENRDDRDSASSDFDTAALAVRFVLSLAAKRAARARGAVRHRRGEHPDTPAEREACALCRAETMIRRGISRAQDERREVAARIDRELERERAERRSGTAGGARP